MTAGEQLIYCARAWRNVTLTSSLENFTPEKTTSLQTTVDCNQKICLSLFRFALLLTGDESAAQELLRETFAATGDSIAQLRRKDRARVLLFREVRQRAPKAPPAAAEGCRETDLPGRVARLAEPERSAFAVFHCGEGTTDELAELIGMRGSKFAEALVRARQSLDPAAFLVDCHRLALHRPWGGDSPRVAKAVRNAGKKPETQASLASQEALDARCHEEIEKIATPPGVLLPDCAPPVSGWWRLLKQPAVLSIAVAVLVVLGVAVYAAMRKLDDFPGKDVVSDLVQETDEMNGTELERITPIEAGKLGDWFMLKGFEDFTVPAELARQIAVGCRVYQHEGSPVALVALDRQHMLLLVFRAVNLKVVLNSATWRVFQQDEWAVAARGAAGNCFVLMGEPAEMETFLKALSQDAKSVAQ